MSRIARSLGTATLLLAGPLTAQERLQYDDSRLDNGLRVILVEDHSVPVVTIDLWYNVGSANERPHRSGFAHLFEHMMFQGSAHAARGMHRDLIAQAGGSMNGTTNEDRTAYFETLPANRLNLGLWLEADRMRSLAITSENFENQRKAVQEERRLRIDNQPYANAQVEGLTMMFDSTACFPYAHSVIGSMDDLNAAQVQDVQAFFDLYYAPENATLVVVGDFDPDATQDLIRDYFGDIPVGAAPPPVQCEVPLGTQAIRKTWEDPLANLPMVIIAHRVPAHEVADTRALQILANILGQGESSRLNLALVREKKTALVAASQIDSRRYAGQFLTLGITNQGTSAEELADQLQAEIARIVESGVSRDELEKAKNSYRHGDIFGRQTTMQVAQSIQHYAHFHESLDDIYTDLDGYMRVTADDIRRVARKYLTPENSMTLLVVPGGAQ